MSNYKVTGNYKPSTSGVGSEQSSSPITDDAESDINQGFFSAQLPVTLPTTEEMYMLTAIEWKNGTTINGSAIGIAYMADAVPPIKDHILVIAQTPLTAQSGSGVVQKVSFDSCVIVKGGSIIHVGVYSNSATGTYRKRTGGTASYKKSLGTVTGIAHTDLTTWINTGLDMYIKLYYKGVH